MPIKVAVQGALGQMGQEVIRAVGAASDLVLVGGCDSKAAAPCLPSSDASDIPLYSDLTTLLADCQPDVIIDFSLAAAVPITAEAAAKAGVSLVIGTTGLAPEVLVRIESLTKECNIGAVIAPNFALGAVIMMELARIAARYFDWAEIIELHHEKKADAPSGTAIATARAMSAARELPFQNLLGDSGHASRGQKFDGVPIHSVRMPGLVASQEIIFGALGQTLLIKHDTINRECFMPGVLMAIREVVKRPGQFVFGLDKLLGL